MEVEHDRCRLEAEGAALAATNTGLETAPSGQPRRRDRPTPGWLLCAVGGNADRPARRMRNVALRSHAARRPERKSDHHRCPGATSPIRPTGFVISCNRWIDQPLAG